MKKTRLTLLLSCFGMIAFMLAGCSAGKGSKTDSKATGSPVPSATGETDLPATQVEVKTDEKHTVFVDAAKGSDSNSGTIEAPVKTLAKAQQLVKGKTAGMTEDVVVYLRGGTYALDETLEFTSEDSGKNGFNVIWTSYKGETATISGGSQISGWTLFDKDKNIWSAPANGIKSRDFFVNGKRAVIARGPAFENMGKLDDQKAFTMAAGSYPDKFERPQDLDILSQGYWSYSIIKVRDMAREGDFQRIYITDDSWRVLHYTIGVAFDTKHLLYMENAYELLDEPGEWYLNTEQDKIYYMPKNGEDMNSTDTVLGKLEKIISFAGDIDNTVDNLTLTGLTFSYSTWLQPSKPEGLNVIQSNVYKSSSSKTFEESMDNANWITPVSAVHGSFVKNVNITYNVFDKIGSGGVHLERAVKNSSISNNYLTDCAGSGISLGGLNFIDHHPIDRKGNNYDEGIKLLSENNKILDNRVTNIGTVYKSACAILVGYVARTNIEYNTLTDLPYTGISLGWGWGFGKQEMNDRMYYMENEKFLLCDNRVAYNYIEDVMKVMWDGGGIYTLGKMDNTVLENNYINQVNNEFGGIYLDNGSSGLTVINNVLSNCHRNWIYKGDYNYIHDNYTSPGTAKEPDYDLREPVKEGQFHYSFENNYMWDESKVNEIKNAAGIRR